MDRFPTRHVRDEDEVSELFREHSGTQKLIGAGLFAIGVAATWLLWEMGWIASVSLLFIVVGIALFASGIAAARSEADAREQWERVRRDHEHLLEGIDDAKRRGVKAVEWLKQQGFTHRGVRNHLLEQHRSRAARERPPIPRERGATPLHAPRTEPAEALPRMREPTLQGHALEDGDITRFEDRCGVVLPPRYQQFLRRWNGGVPKPAWFAFKRAGEPAEGVVELFFSMGTGGSDSLDGAIEAHKVRTGKLPKPLLPVAREAEGALICLVITGEDEGAVVLWEEGDVTAGVDDATHHLSDSWFSFLASITWAPGTEPPPAPKARRRL